MVAERLPGTSLATVYNALDALCEAGLCQRLPTHVGGCRFDAECADHVHAALPCGRIVDVPDELGRRLLTALPDDLLAEAERRLGAPIARVGLRLELSGGAERSASA